MKCPACDGELLATGCAWQFRCPHCRYRASALTANVGHHSTSNRLDESRRELALGGLRQRNFERILDRLEPWADPTGASLLDVGSAHGWFLDAAARRGFQVAGLEPEAWISEPVRSRGHRVVTGYFPASLPASPSYDVITFHDVFEHLPDVAGAAEACRALLHPDGLVVVNLPSSSGIFFRLAELLARCGITRFRDRMWQKDFPSPHFSYFRPSALALLMERHGFRELARSTLPSIELRGLWRRLRYDRDSSLAGSLAVWLVVVVMRPVLALLPADITLQIFRRQG